jgi:hypothetical protein
MRRLTFTLGPPGSRGVITGGISSQVKREKARKKERMRLRMVLELFKGEIAGFVAEMLVGSVGFW